MYLHHTAFSVSRALSPAITTVPIPPYLVWNLENAAEWAAHFQHNSGIASLTPNRLKLAILLSVTLAFLIYGFLKSRKKLSYRASFAGGRDF
jgi:hypothetical protein